MVTDSHKNSTICTDALMIFMHVEFFETRNSIQHYLEPAHYFIF